MGRGGDAVGREVLLAAAAAQLELAVRESAGPVEELGGAIERMSLGMVRLRAQLAATGQSAPHISCQELLKELAVCAESLQFYDRLVQHLSHLQAYLLGLEHTPANWQQLRVLLRQHLISEGQRDLLDAILPPSRDMRPPGEGSIELF